MLDFLWVAPCDHNGVTLTTNFHWHLFDKNCMVLKSNTAQCVLHPGAILVQSSPGAFLMGCVVSSLHSVHCTLNTEHYKYTLHTGAKFTWWISYWLQHPVITVVSPWHPGNKLPLVFIWQICIAPLTLHSTRWMDFLWLATSCVITNVSQWQQCIASFQIWRRCHEVVTNVTNNRQIPIAMKEDNISEEF